MLLQVTHHDCVTKVFGHNTIYLTDNATKFSPRFHSQLRKFPGPDNTIVSICVKIKVLIVKKPTAAKIIEG